MLFIDVLLVGFLCLIGINGSATLKGSGVITLLKISLFTKLFSNIADEDGDVDNSRSAAVMCDFCKCLGLVVSLVLLCLLIDACGGDGNDIVPRGGTGGEGISGGLSKLHSSSEGMGLCCSISSNGSSSSSNIHNVLSDIASAA